MEIIILVAKIVTTAFFGVIFLANLVGLMRSGRTKIGFEIKLEKQLWMIISLLVIFVVLGGLS